MKTALSIAVAAFVATSAQAAPVVGSTANGRLSAPCCGTFLNQNAVVGAGTEFSFAGGSFSVLNADLSDTQVILTSLTGNSVNLGANVDWSFTLAPSLVFASITEVSDNFLNGSALTSFSGNVASFRIRDQGHGKNQTFTAVYNISVRELNAVPEPASLALALTALLGAAAARRRVA